MERAIESERGKELEREMERERHRDTESRVVVLRDKITKYMSLYAYTHLYANTQIFANTQVTPAQTHTDRHTTKPFSWFHGTHFSDQTTWRS